MKDNFCWSFYDTLRRLKEFSEGLMQPFCAENGLTCMQLHLLLALYFEGPQTAGALAHRAALAEANGSALCKKLDQGGYVERKRSSTDERQVVVSLTPAGKEVVRRFIKVFEKGIAAGRAAIDPEDLQVMEAGFARLYRLLKKRSV